MRKIFIRLLIASVLLSMVFGVPAMALGPYGNPSFSTDTINDVFYFGQSFTTPTPSQDIFVTDVRLWIESNSSFSQTPRDVKVAIRSIINGANLGESSTTSVPFYPSWGPTGFSDFNFATPVHLTAGATYFLDARASVPPTCG